MNTNTQIHMYVAVDAEITGMGGLQTGRNLPLQGREIKLLKNFPTL